MLLRSRRAWELPESAATPEAVFRDRRRFLKAAAGVAAASIALPGRSRAGLLDFLDPIAVEADPTADLYPLERNPAFSVSRPFTEEKWATSYNNFFELSGGKRLKREASKLPLRPWRIEVGGLVAKPFEIDVDELIRSAPLEERVYRHRCVEAWAMAVPWTGFPLRHLVDRAEPTADARYLQMTSFNDRAVAPRLRLRSYPWPYVEALTIDEARNDLAILATGLYGKPLPKQNGAPLRLVVPWKYGFKSIKSIVRFEFVAERPKSFWVKQQGDEYGFWANVNPEVHHPRWSQAVESMLGTGDEYPTRLFNGYGEQVAHMYRGIEGERLYF